MTVESGGQFSLRYKHFAERNSWMMGPAYRIFLQFIGVFMLLCSYALVFTRTN